MFQCLIVTTNKNTFSNLVKGLEKNNEVKIDWESSGQKALELISKISFAFIVADESLSDMTGLNFVKKVTKQNPMINCVLSSGLSEKEFHETTEGLGIMFHLSLYPDETNGAEILTRFKHINGLMNL